MEQDLFGLEETTSSFKNQRGGNDLLEQFFTPEWAALRLVENFYPNLDKNSFVVEPTCGFGAFLKAIPDYVPAMGIEIDPVLAKKAEENTGRSIICGDFRTVELPKTPTLVIGNPPWNVDDVTGLLNHYHGILPESGEVGIIIPAHRLSYSGPVLELSRKWSINQTILPKSLFPRLSWPIIFAQFKKEQIRKMVGFFLFEESESIKNAPPRVRLLLINGKNKVGLWHAVVHEALNAIGRNATLSEIYSYVEGRKPKPISTWRDTIRRVLQEKFQRFDDGTWNFAAP